MRTLPVLAILALASCGGSQATSTSTTTTEPAATVDAAPRGPGVTLKVDPADATIVVDGQEVGSAAGLPGGFVALAPGIHQIAISKPGYETWRAEVMVHEEPEAITIQLKPVTQ